MHWYFYKFHCDLGRIYFALFSILWAYAPICNILICGINHIAFSYDFRLINMWLKSVPKMSQKKAHLTVFKCLKPLSFRPPPGLQPGPYGGLTDPTPIYNPLASLQLFLTVQAPPHTHTLQKMFRGPWKRLRSFKNLMVCPKFFFLQKKKKNGDGQTI